MPPAHRIVPAQISPAQPSRPSRRSVLGFTLVEILTATAIMALLVSLVMVILTQVMTAWNRSSDDLTFSTNARAVFDIIGQDLQGCILRSDGNQWLSLTPDKPPVGSAIPDVEDSRLIFFTSTPLHLTKDYSAPGSVGKTIAGDICTVEYRVIYADPFGTTPTPGATTNTKTYILHRVVIDPVSTFYGIDGTNIMGLNNTTTPVDLPTAFDNVIDIPSNSANGVTPSTNQTPVIAIPYGGSTGPSALNIPIYGAYSTTSALLANVAQFSVFLYFNGQDPGQKAQSVQTYPQNYKDKTLPASIYYGGNPNSSVTSGYLDLFNGAPSFLNLAFADITLSIMTDDGVAILQQNNGALPQGMTWPQFLQKFSKTFTQRVPILSSPH